ncbi:MAG: CPBP family intramembrane glutamic endopeptidase [Candidatus Scatomorpha sp.]|jgi:membrane protease YdiL (CAAX protease family)
MYQTKNKTYAAIAIIYFIAMMFGYYLMGVLYKSGNKYFSGIQWSFLIIAVLIVLIKDKSFSNLGFTKEKIKSNLLFAAIIAAASIAFAFLYTDRPAAVIAKAALYYLFYVALLEEIIFRGFMQNYLFGLRLNRKIIYAIGAVFFSLVHLPFQMFVNDMISFSYIITAIPQLIFTFFLHLIMCFITYKRKDILIPTALHFALNFVQEVL